MTVWEVSSPSAWPNAPRWMSFSALTELESCPRRWALSSADYKYLWDKNGYPHTIQPSMLEGKVVHLALEKITNALAKCRCPSLIDERAYLTLKNLGGYTAIIVDCLNNVLWPYETNPRAVPILEGVRRRLEARVPELRALVQRLLSRIHLESSPRNQFDINTHGIGKSRCQLQHGSHAEVNLCVTELGWHGIADLLTLSSGLCEIRDFKTGTYKKQHESQLHTYALLWARDQTLNPTGRLADRLVLSYNDRDVDVSVPELKELLSLENEIGRAHV